MLVEGSVDVAHSPPPGSGHKSTPPGRTTTPSLHTPVNVDARLANTPPHVLIRSISSLSQHSVRPRTPEQDDEELQPLRKGVLLQARDRLFSRWKERYFVLTRDYLACFRRGTTKYSEMGPFIFKVNLANVECIEWQDRKGGPALALSLPREGRVLLRAKAGLELWYRNLKDATHASRQRRIALRKGTSTTNLAVPPTFESSLRTCVPFNLSDSSPEIAQLRDSGFSNSPNLEKLQKPSSHFAALTSEGEMSAYDTDGGTPSTHSYTSSSNKFSSSTSASSNSGSGESSSLASSPSICMSRPWLGSPLRPALSGDVSSAPRSRFSLYEGSKETMSSAKTRHSVCLEPLRPLQSEAAPVVRRRLNLLASNRNSLASESKELAASRASLVMEPRNPLVELLESVESAQVQAKQAGGAATAPRESGGSLQGKASPLGTDKQRPRAHSTSVNGGGTEAALAPRSRTNLALFRTSGLFN